MPELESTEPLYAQVKQRLLSDIDAEILAPGDLLPAESELCKKFGISRITLRRAVTDLCDEGRLVRQQGRGTFVAPRPVPQALISLSGFSEALEAMGKTVRHVVLAHDAAAEDVRARAVLGIAPGAHPARFLRLITVDDRPLTLETLFIDTGRFPGISDPIAKGESFYRTLQARHGIAPAGTERTISVGYTRPDERASLCVPASQPVYRIEKTIFAPDDEPIALSRLVTPTNLVIYTVRN